MKKQKSVIVAVTQSGAVFAFGGVGEHHSSKGVPFNTQQDAQHALDAIKESEKYKEVLLDFVVVPLHGINDLKRELKIKKSLRVK